VVFILFTADAFLMFWLFAHGWWGQASFIFGIVVGLFILGRILFVWRKNILVITTHRVVDIDQRGFFDKTVSEVPYDQVEDVSGRIKGVLGTILRYGDLTIQTGKGKVEIVVSYIKQPMRVQQKINELREGYLSRYWKSGEDVI
jgi:membrane protein YdbS with pleckstrin-like domain